MGRIRGLSKTGFQAGNRPGLEFFLEECATVIPCHDSGCVKCNTQHIIKHTVVTYNIQNRWYEKLHVYFFNDVCRCYEILRSTHNHCVSPCNHAMKDFTLLVTISRM